MMLYERLMTLFPDAQFGDWVLIERDGVQSILTWNRPEPQPTAEELNAITVLSLVQAQRLDYITKRRNAALADLTAEWGGHVWDANEATSSRVANALSMIREAAAQGLPTPSSIPWRTADNQDVVLSIAGLTEMGAAVFLTQQTVWVKQAALKNQIAAATTVEEAQAVEW